MRRAPVANVVVGIFVFDAHVNHAVSRRLVVMNHSRGLCVRIIRLRSISNIWTKLQEFLT